MKCVLCLGLLLALVAVTWGTEWSFAAVSDQDLGLPPDLGSVARPRVSIEVPGRRIPALIASSNLSAMNLADYAVPLPQANTRSHVNFRQRRVGRRASEQGLIQFFNPETVLVKFRGQPLVSALRVEPLREWNTIQALRHRSDVEFAELDTFERRQFTPDDPQLASQWHHGVIGSFQAWSYSLGQPSVRIAIVDTPFQMDHPDLAANTVTGWDAVANMPVTASSGIVHSTMCAGMAAAVIDNSVGVAGAGNCEILPININGALSEMYNAIIWAADHGVRVVNLSWSGANSDTLEAAGYYLKTNTAGILAMAAIDGTGFLNWTNQPDIYCLSMTDAADNFQQTMYGNYIDFAAPGYQVYSTTTGGGYGYGSGTSYATPLFCGAVAVLFSINPALGPDDVINILKATAVPLGPQQYFGWGRIDFGASAAKAAATLPRVSGIQVTNGRAVITAAYNPGLKYLLWRTPQLAPPAWQSLSNTIIQTNANGISLTDPSPPETNAFYRMQFSLP